MASRRRSIIAMVFVAIGSLFADIGASAAPLTFGIVPQQSASRLITIWSPLLDYLGARTGLEFAFATAKDIPTFEACLAKRAYDIAYMNPYHYTVFHGRSGYQAFAHQADRKLKGLLAVRKDSKIHRLEDLAGAEIAFPSPAAFGASVLTRAELRRHGIDFTPRYVNSHDSTYQAVGAGLVAAGGGVVRTFDSIGPTIRGQLRILYETHAYTPHAFAALDSLPARDVEALLAAMLAAGDDAPDLLRPAGFSGFQRAVDADWDDVRSLDLQQRDTEIVIGKLESCHSG